MAALRVLQCCSAALLLFGAASAAPAQRDKEPRRPKLAAGADTNDAHAYYDFAIGVLSDDAQKAADALYWSTRIDPSWADPYYARRVALLLVDPTRFTRYSSGDARAQEDARAIDSLYYRALTINPFVSQRLDRKLLDGMIDELARRSGNSGNARFAMELAMQRWPPSMRARLAYGDGKLDEALILYTLAIEKNQKSVSLRLDRARLLFEADRPEQSLIDLNGVLEELRKSDQKDLIFVYRSKALTEHGIAVVQQRLGNVSAAKEAYGRALQEDLSYYPAHLQLALIALDQKDTVTALAEMDLATQLRPDDAAAQYLYGYALVRAGKANAAIEHLKRANQLDPVYAAPKLIYARILQSADFKEEAIAAYKEFLALAARNDPNRAAAQSNLAALETSPHGGSYR
jgi:tetratricopeptide (TPR) repeat protein